jgi:hypothetical protein
LCVEIEGGLPGFDCICPTGWIGGPRFECIDPNNIRTIIVFLEYFYINALRLLNAVEIPVYENLALESATTAGFTVVSANLFLQTFVKNETSPQGYGNLTTVIEYTVITSQPEGRRRLLSDVDVANGILGQTENLLEDLTKDPETRDVFSGATTGGGGMDGTIESRPYETPSPTPAPTPAPAVNRTRALLQLSETLPNDGIEDTEAHVRTAIFPLNHGSLPSKTVYITGPSKPEQTIESILQAQANDVEIKYFDNLAVIESVKMISALLEEEGVFGAYDAFAALKPWAYRTDLWRLMVLWAYGGVYLDADLLVEMPLEFWASLEDHQEIATCVDFIPFASSMDGNVHAVMYQAMLSAKKGSPLVLEVIRHILDNVTHRRYGLPGEYASDLAITGPVLFGKAVHGQYDKVRLSCKVNQRMCGDDVCAVVEGYVPMAVEMPWLGWYSPVRFAKNNAVVRYESHLGSYSGSYKKHEVYCEDGEACLVE